MFFTCSLPGMLSNTVIHSRPCLHADTYLDVQQIYIFSSLAIGKCLTCYQRTTDKANWVLNGSSWGDTPEWALREFLDALNSIKCTFTHQALPKPDLPMLFPLHFLSHSHRDTHLQASPDLQAETESKANQFWVAGKSHMLVLALLHCSEVKDWSYLWNMVYGFLLFPCSSPPAVVEAVISSVIREKVCSPSSPQICPNNEEFLFFYFFL